MMIDINLKPIFAVLIGIALISAVYQVVMNPMSRRWDALQQSTLENVSVLAVEDFDTHTDYRLVYDLLEQRPGLWRPLIAAPKAVTVKKPPPDGSVRLAGIEITQEMTNVDGDVFVMVVDKNRKTEGWMTIGDSIRQHNRIDAINADHVVLSFGWHGERAKVKWPRK